MKFQNTQTYKRNLFYPNFFQTKKVQFKFIITLRLLKFSVAQHIVINNLLKKEVITLAWRQNSRIDIFAEFITEGLKGIRLDLKKGNKDEENILQFSTID